MGMILHVSVCQEIPPPDDYVPRRHLARDTYVDENNNDVYDEREMEDDEYDDDGDDDDEDGDEYERDEEDQNKSNAMIEDEYYQRKTKRGSRQRRPCYWNPYWN